MLHRIAVQLRGAEIKGRTLVGLASVYDVDAEVDGATVEAIAPGAFDDVLADDRTDARALWNHDPRYLLGRQSSGTLRVATSAEGLPYSVDLPQTSYAEDLIELVRRGDLDGASFGFVPGVVQRSRTEDGRTRTTHVAIRELVDVSPVTFPAYAGASTALRHRTHHPAGDRRVRSQLIMIRHRVREARP